MRTQPAAACVSVLLRSNTLYSFNTVPPQRTVVKMIPYPFVCPNVQFTQLGDLVRGRPHDEG